MGGAVSHLEPGPPNNEKDRKRMAMNGGIRPGKKWPQFLAAGSGTWLVLCLMLLVLGRVQKYIADQLKVATSIRCLLLFFSSHLSLYSLPLRNKRSRAVKVCRQKSRLRYDSWFAGRQASVKRPSYFCVAGYFECGEGP
jgi:hypothetical protein